MEISIILAKQIASLLIIVLVGFCTVHFGYFTDRDTFFLTKLNINIICPCAIVNSFQIQFTMDKLRGLLVAALAAAIIQITFILLNVLLRRPFQLKPVESASVIYTNALNLILPLVMAILDEDMVFYCIAYSLIQVFLMWTHGKALVSGYTQLSFRQILNTNVVAMLIGLALFLCRISLPSIIGTPVKSLGSLMGPVSMLILGMLVGNMDLKKAFSTVRIYRIVFLRLILLPLIAVLILVYSGLGRLHPDSGRIFLITLLAASSCTASNIPQMARLYSEDGEYAGMINLVSLVCCVVSMPLIVLIYQLLI